MTFELPPLPFDKNALEPFMSAQTLDFHHGKHHNAYVVNLNNLIKDGHALSGKSLEEVIVASSKDSSMQGVFNNAAQIWNHTFFWNCLKPQGGGAPTGVIAEKINASFGSYEKFAEEFKNAALTQFGSGWAWLVANGNELKIVKTPNAETPLTGAHTPLLTVDVWEHAYYLDFQNRRPDFVQTFLDKLLNWDFVNANFANAQSKAA